MKNFKRNRVFFIISILLFLFVVYYIFSIKPYTGTPLPISLALISGNKIIANATCNSIYYDSFVAGDYLNCYLEFDEIKNYELSNREIWYTGGLRTNVPYCSFDNTSNKYKCNPFVINIPYVGREQFQIIFHFEQKNLTQPLSGEKPAIHSNSVSYESVSVTDYHLNKQNSNIQLITILIALFAIFEGIKSLKELYESCNFKFHILKDKKTKPKKRKRKLKRKAHLESKKRKKS